MDCLFCDIASGKIPADTIYEDEKVIAFNDINPQAKVHFLVIPKKHYVNLLDLPSELATNIIDVIKKIVKEKNLATDGFRVITNTNEFGGQEIFHAHFHVLAGEKLSGKMG